MKKLNLIEVSHESDVRGRHLWYLFFAILISYSLAVTLFTGTAVLITTLLRSGS